MRNILKINFIRSVAFIFVILVMVLTNISPLVHAAKKPTTLDMIKKGIYYYDPQQICAEDTEEQTGATWEDRLQAATDYSKKLDNKVGFTVVEADSGKIIGGYNQDLQGNIASMLKAFVMAAYLDKYKDQEISPNMKPKLEKMIRESDGAMYNEVKKALGGEGPLTNFISDKLKVQGSAPKDMSAQVSPEQMATGFAHIEDAMPEKHRKYGLGLLSSIVKEHQWGMVPAAESTGWDWHVKAGWINNNTHQSGLFFKGSEKVAISIMQPDISTPNKDPIDKDPVSFKGQKNIEAITKILLNDTTSNGGGVYMVGDSIGEGVKGTLQSKLKSSGYDSISLDTAVSRSLTDKGEGQTSGLKALEDSKDVIAKSSNVVVQLGTNGDTNSKNIKKAIDIIKKSNKDANIYWVNIGTTSKDNGLPKNRVDTNKDLEKDTDLGYKVIDWSKEVGESDKENLLSDGVHPNDKGGKILANLIVNDIAVTNNNNKQYTNPNNNKPIKVSNSMEARAKVVWSFLISPDGLGLTPVQAAGAMGNIEQESGFGPRIVQGPEGPGDLKIDGSTGYGLIQWTTADRQKGLKDMAIKMDMDPGTFEVQFAFMKKELSGAYKNTLDRLKKVDKDVVEATLVWHGAGNFNVPGVTPTPGYESSGDTESFVRGKRGGDAKKWLAKFGNINVSYQENSGKCDNNDDEPSVSGEFAFPTEKKYWKTARSEFTSPHHDYPAIDIGLPVPEGANIYSMTSGKIISAPADSASSGYGLGVRIKYDNDVEIIYGHGKDGGEIKDAKEGDTVEPGQLIMHLGNTGHSFGAHLHLEIRYKGKSVCPQKFVEAVAEEKTVPKFSELGTEGCHT